MRIKSRELAALLLFVAPQVWATDHTVFVGQTGGVPATAFDPSTLTVRPGDRIIFNNQFGGFHNAHSMNSAFPFQCGHDGCESAAPDLSVWTATVVVPVSAAGHTVYYLCDLHGPAMVGSITVETLTPATLKNVEME